MKHLDLFSGIGGFALAVDAVWQGSEHIFCDNDKFCQAILKLRYPNSKIYGDIRGITENQITEWSSSDTEYNGTTGERGDDISKERKIQDGEETSSARTLDNRNCGSKTRDVYLLTGGFPCQPFSQAGKRKGTSDDRFLWPEMLRVIRLVQPAWVIAENVRGILTIEHGMVFEQVCTDLEDSGYEVQPFIIPAVSVNAPHRRDRVWFVAHRTSNGFSRWIGECQGQDSWEQNGKRFGSRFLNKVESDNSDDRNPRCERLERGNTAHGSKQDILDVKNPIGERSGRGNEDGRQVLERQSPEVQDQRPSWESNWIEVATELCGVDDGLPAGLDGYELSKSQHRVQRLKALGNAIVPQVAIEIMKAINLTHTIYG